MIRILVCVVLLAWPAAAQTGEAAAPLRGIRLIVPFAPGGATDTLARLVAEPLGRRLGQAVAVENRAGAGGLIAGEACARAAPDGLTLCIGSSATHSVLPLQMPERVGANPAGFTPISRFGEEAGVLVVGHAHPAADLTDLLDWARGQAVVPVGVSGTTGASYLMTRQIGIRTGLRLEPVLYRGGAQTQTAVIAGEVPLGSGLISSFATGLRSGELRAILVLSPTRSAQLPGVPAVGEALLPGAGVTTYTGLFGPAGMTMALATRIHAAVADSLQEPALRVRAAAIGLDINPLGPMEFAAWLRDTAPAWAELVALGTSDPLRSREPPSAASPGNTTP